MNEEIDFLKAIEERKSIRNYLPDKIVDEDIDLIQAYLDDEKNLVAPFGSNIHLKIISNNISSESEKIGTYGMVKNTQNFLVGTCENNLENLFDFGYVVEKLVLYLVSLGIGSCWLGGTFERKKIQKSILLKHNEFIPAILSLGYPAEKLHLKEKIVRNVIRANKRKPKDELFFLNYFENKNHHFNNEIDKALEYVRLAPSAKNAQPWRLIVEDDFSKVHFYISNSIGETKDFPYDPALIDIGIAYSHFDCVMQSLGISGKLLQNDPLLKINTETTYIATWIKE